LRWHYSETGIYVIIQLALAALGFIPAVGSFPKIAPVIQFTIAVPFLFHLFRLGNSRLSIISVFSVTISSV